MFAIRRKNGFIIVDYLVYDDVENSVEEFYSTLEEEGGIITISDCGSAAFGEESFSTTCECGNECHSGWRIEKNEILGLVFVPEKEYHRLRRWYVDKK
ncbi:hypothetical protein Tfer_0888 [Thermincola ferriacetica]|uniref:Uncharacterized protein n=1 Tax=Thermincola ferriacetica TaxID=281456 RepID=A0A0L6W4L4_9FIRM|nr:hypothetical protein [Thermincola ferriacetica]KNZ70328.1 hypothetical protein Tfer_0888 [Thermincola ferriacetica]